MDEVTMTPEMTPQGDSLPPEKRQQALDGLRRGVAESLEKTRGKS